MIEKDCPNCNESIYLSPPNVHKFMDMRKRSHYFNFLKKAKAITVDTGVKFNCPNCKITLQYFDHPYYSFKITLDEKLKGINKVERIYIRGIGPIDYQHYSKSKKIYESIKALLKL